MSKKIITSVQTEGFEAVLYPGDGRKDKVMIVMSGSDGGMTLRSRSRNSITKMAFPHWRWHFSKQSRHRKNFPGCRSSLWKRQSDGWERSKSI